MALKFKVEGEGRGGKKNGTFRLLSKLTHLIEKSFRELLEALSTYKTLLMVQLTVTVHNLLGGCKTPPAALTSGIGQSIGHVTVKTKDRKSQINLCLAIRPKNRKN